MWKRRKRLTKFQNQLDAVDKATPRARIGSEKISPMTTHAAGPQVEAKKKMYRQTNTIRHMEAAWDPGAAVPTMATMYSQINMPTRKKSVSGLDLCLGLDRRPASATY